MFSAIMIGLDWVTKTGGDRQNNPWLTVMVYVSAQSLVRVISPKIVLSQKQFEIP